MENTVINEVIAAANNVDKEVREAVLGNNFDNENFVKIDTAYPELIKDGEAPVAKEVAIQEHLAYVDRITKLSLTHSLFLGLGFEVPTGHALSANAVEQYLEQQKSQITFTNVADENDDIAEIWKVEVLLGDATYTFLETDKWLAGLRALHFLVTRHDPDMTEYVNRKLAQSGGLGEDWLKEVHKAK